MGYKNMRELLVAGAQLPAAIEKALPEGAPKLSTKLIDFANRVPEGPGFPMEIPNLPAPPEFKKPGNGTLGKPMYVREVEVVPIEARKTAPAPASEEREIIPSPAAAGTIPEVITRRGL